MNHDFSLTKATEIFLKHYNIWSENISKEVLTYNTHKVRHVLWVLETWRNIIIKLKENQVISNETIKRAELTFLFHDLWRFYQNDKKRVLLNSEFEHGDESAKITKEEGYDDKVVLAIKYHNKYSIEKLFLEPDYLKMNDEDKNETVFLAKLIRDADKLQNMIYDTFNIENIIKLDPYAKDLPKWDLSQDILDDLKNHLQVNRNNIKTLSDYYVSNLSRIYDINFQESIDMLKYYGYFQKIYNIIDAIPEVTKSSKEVLVEHILNYKK